MGRNSEEGLVQKNGKVLYSTRRHYGEIIQLDVIDEDTYRYKGKLPPEGSITGEEVEETTETSELLLNFIERVKSERLEKGQTGEFKIIIGEHTVSSDMPDLKKVLEEATKNPYPERTAKQQESLKESQDYYSLD